MADVKRMYAAKLGTDNLRGGGIPSDGLGLEGSDDAELTTGSSTRRSERIKKPNIVTNVSVLGDVAKVYKDVCGMFAETGGDATVEEGNPTSTREA